MIINIKCLNKFYSKILLLIMALCLMVGVSTYNHYINYYSQKNSYAILNEALMQQSQNFKTKLKADKNFLKMAAESFANNVANFEINYYYLHQLLQDTSFDELFVSNLSGDIYSSSGQVSSIAAREYFHEILTGETIITNVLTSVIDNTKIIAIGTPIIKNNQIIGALIGTYDIHQLSNSFLQPFNGHSANYIFDNNGSIIARSNLETINIPDNNLYNLFNGVEFKGRGDIENSLLLQVDESPFNLEYQVNHNDRILSVAKLGINDWNILTSVNKSIIADNTNAIINATYLASLIMVFVIIIFSLYILSIKNKHLKKLEKIAYYDDLTPALTLNGFRNNVRNIIKQCNDQYYLIIKFDIADFKMINNNYSYHIGDNVLINIAKGLKSIKQQYPDLIYARFNTDEFLCFLSSNDQTNITMCQQLIYDVVIDYGEQALDHSISIKMGSYCFESCDELLLSQILERVNFAHRKAKVNNLDICHFETHIEDKFKLKNDIMINFKTALANREFKTFLQPKYDIQSQTINGAEALVRWCVDGQVKFYPDQFIPNLEQNGKIVELDMYMYTNVCQILRQQMDNGYRVVPISVNFSRHHLYRPTFVAELIAVAAQYQISPSLLEVELTESVFFEDEEILIKIIKNIHDAGFAISIDDFGVGYSSLGLLKNINVNTIKLDKTFIDISKDYNKSEIVVASVLQMAHQLGIKTVAEGVETLQQLEMLMQHNCDTAQGYYFCRPITVEKFNTKLNKAA